MKFLIKIEDAINKLILSFGKKIHKAIPAPFYVAVNFIKQTPGLILKKVSSLLPKIRIIFLKTIGYFQHYSTMVRGHIVGFQIYLRSEEFKNKNKKDLILAPILKFKTDPIKAFSILATFVIFSFSSMTIYKNVSKIIKGTKALRAPASIIVEEPILEFEKIKYRVLNDKEVTFDITITASSIEERDKLIPIEKDIKNLLSSMQLQIAQLPPTKDEITQIEKSMLGMIEGAKISSVEIKQVLDARPKYFMQIEKMLSMKDLNLQIFLEDTKRNRQVWVDFTALATNRNIILFLKDHEIEVRDYINMEVEPVIPQLPIEEEGRQIIKDKLKLELNEYLKKSNIEGKIQEVYIDYIIVS